MKHKYEDLVVISKSVLDELKDMFYLPQRTFKQAKPLTPLIENAFDAGEKYGDAGCVYSTRVNRVNKKEFLNKEIEL